MLWRYNYTALWDFTADVQEDSNMNLQHLSQHINWSSEVLSLML